MSVASKKGKDFELRVAKITKKILGIETRRDSRSGAGFHKQDIRDRYNHLPLSIECKDQKTLAVKKEWRVTDGKSSFGQAPVVVFPDDEEILCVMRYSDVLQFIKEARDWKQEADAMRQGPVKELAPTDSELKKRFNEGFDKFIGPVIEHKFSQGAKSCREGHIADQYGYCMQLKCRYSRGYRPPKIKKK